MVNRNGCRWKELFTVHFKSFIWINPRKPWKIFGQISQCLGWHWNTQPNFNILDTISEGTHKISTPPKQCCVLTIVLNMFFKHFKPQYTAHFSQCFQVIYMNNEWTKNIIQCCTETFKVRPEVKYENKCSEVTCKEQLCLPPPPKKKGGGLCVTHTG